MGKDAREQFMWQARHLCEWISIILFAFFGGGTSFEHFERYAGLGSRLSVFRPWTDILAQIADAVLQSGEWTAVPLRRSSAC